jgi:CheY-like chemotaxis protein
VDDEPGLLEVAMAYLGEMGCTALEAKDGVSALKIVGERPDIDLIVTDIVMPGGMDGVELVHRVRAIHPEMKFIYSSGFPAKALAERSGPQIDGPLLRKPYQRSEFAVVVNSEISKCRAERGG